MLRIDLSKPYKLVYSVCKHEYLGYLIEPHIVQLNPNLDFSYTHQRIFSHTLSDFNSVLEPLDLKIIKLLDNLDQDSIIKKYYKKKIRPTAFFTQVFDQKTFEVLRPKIDKKINEVLQLLQPHRDLYEMDKEGWPVEHRVHIPQDPASILFHFRRNETETRYFPTIKHENQRIEFMFKEAQIICNMPAWLLLNHTLYHFDQELEGKKLQPFLNKRYISIPKSTEAAYFEKFVAPLIEKHHVYAEGFQIKTEQYQAIPVLKVVFVEGGLSYLQLNFKYGPYTFPLEEGSVVTVKLQQNENDFTFYRIKRSLSWERTQLNFLTELGIARPETTLNHFLVQGEESLENPSYAALNWVNEHLEDLQSRGFEIEQSQGDKKFVVGHAKIDFEIKEQNDWFDIYAMVYFGKYEIPFLALKEHILHKKREFVLPDGSIAIIPDKWFSQYGSLFAWAEAGKNLKLKKHHVGLIQELADDGIAQISMERKLQRLSSFEHIDEYPMPLAFEGQLRAYQKAGYNWFHFLREFNFGGCLADDMGLGKTIQTLALLQKIKEEEALEGRSASSLIIMPTSLIYNWEREAHKFTPNLKILNHTGAYRSKDVADFANYDLILTTYGVSRVDTELFKDFYFHYIILDESQNIKNPSSKSFKAVRSFKSKYRLILSGTPLENSVNDLWSQLSFLNPGLLGSHSFFNEHYVQAIERKKDEDKVHKLQSIIKPFVLRRTKEQVAAELPPKTEQVFYCDMTEAQAEAYEQTKSSYRNDLIENIERPGAGKKQITLLQGLMKLRQLANHPLMIDEQYSADSGKFENVIYTLQNVLDGGHKVLMFSQFVKHLEIFKAHFEKQGLPFAYLDGSTKDRAEVIARFQKEDSVKLFLISLKAGGVGLNLTEADYVFILDPWWNPAVERQAIDRTHRIGQDKKVFVYKFISKDSVEEKILALQSRKSSLASNLITTEESFIKSLSKADIEELLS